MPQAEFAYNSTSNSSMGVSPFSVVYQIVPYHLLDLAKLFIGEKFSNAASAMPEQAIYVQKEVRIKLEKSNTRYKIAADKRRREKSLEKETW